MAEEVVLDAYALLAHLQAERAGPEVTRWMEEAADGRHRLLMTTVNWGEVLYNVAMRDEQLVDEVVAALEGLPLALVSVDRGLVVRAAALKAEHRLGYADAIAAALALSLGARLMTGDPAFRRVPGVELVWLGG